MNYSKEQTKYWKQVISLLKQNPDADVLIMRGQDCLCSGCPALDKNMDSSCRENSVNFLDNKIADILNIRTNSSYKYSEIVEKLNSIMTPKIHKELCSLCAWWKKGLCRSSFDK